jgi:dethiobiotin synthetase
MAVGGPQPGASRPERLVVVVGTGTEVGKTWVTDALARELRSRGTDVSARKPAQSFEPEDRLEGRTDAQLLAAATGEDPMAVCPDARWYPVPMAPPMAAEVLGLPPFGVADLVAELSWPEGAAVGLVETAGGLRSPVAADGDCLDLVVQLQPDLVLLVADAGLGTINAVRLCADALGTASDAASRAGRAAVPAPIVVLNRFEADDDLHGRNRDWLERVDGLRCVTNVTYLADGVLS